MELGAIPVIPEKTSCSGDACRDVTCKNFCLGLLPKLKAAVNEDERCVVKTNTSNFCKPFIIAFIDYTSRQVTGDLWKEVCNS
mmetsp:Transcript_21226/g.35027  ORF Transcript_21226/g.35027 Transcript_21226/m.35027 type:complete len:83 (-) Transcript_21226:62-310(-)